MRHRAHSTALVSAFALAAPLFAGQAVARADAPAPTTPSSRAVAAPKPALKHAPPARPRETSADDQSLYGCHPKDDLSCTVIHETSRGIVVVTFRPTGAKEKRVWSVVNEPADVSAGSSGGTIYVVPGAAPTATVAQPTTRSSDNNTPIID